MNDLENLSICPNVLLVEREMTFYRIFTPRENSGPVDFRFFGPYKKGRFDHHLGKAVYIESSEDHLILYRREPGNDPERGILYSAWSFETCILEVFKDQGIIDIKDQELASFRNIEELRLLDLRSLEKCQNAGTLLPVTFDMKRHFTQTWSRCFYSSTSIYGIIDGVIHNNRHNREATITLYERSINKIELIERYRLNSNSLRPALEHLAECNDLLIPPESFLGRADD
jgi:hypothetical protein